MPLVHQLIFPVDKWHWHEDNFLSLRKSNRVARWPGPLCRRRRRTCTSPASRHSEGPQTEGNAHGAAGAWAAHTHRSPAARRRTAQTEKVASGESFWMFLRNMSGSSTTTVRVESPPPAAEVCRASSARVASEKRQREAGAADGGPAEARAPPRVVQGRQARAPAREDVAALRAPADGGRGRRPSAPGHREADEGCWRGSLLLRGGGAPRPHTSTATNKQ